MDNHLVVPTGIVGKEIPVNDSSQKKKKDENDIKPHPKLILKTTRFPPKPNDLYPQSIRPSPLHKHYLPTSANLKKIPKPIQTLTTKKKNPLTPLNWT